MTNIYQTHACVEDCHNDLNILMSIRSDLNDTRAKICKYLEQNSMAFEPDVLRTITYAIDMLDQNTIEPTEHRIREALEHHASERIQGMA